ncbi:MAG: c-type cytochrome [Planctomycetota bacterium]
MSASFASGLLLSLVAPVALWAAPQNGDAAGEEQPPLPADLVIPAAPPLPWEEQLATFEVPAGYAVELVAAEPLVRDPVVTAWDAEGRLWVCEMRAYMRDVDGTDEDEPIGEIAVLEDTDGDGRMDKRTVFLDGLVLPRAILPTRGGLLYIEPPRMLFCRDVDGDGRGDETEVLETGLGGIQSPEHAINGLLPGIDNWILCANHGFRFRWNGEGEWERQRVGKAGQWGVAKDDLGRVFFNTNSDPLRGDPYSSHYAVRNANLGRANGVNVGYAKDRSVWPARITPGVNRGYRDGTLREDFTLARFTGACSPYVYRGEALPELSGDAFICEPCGHLLKRYRLEERPNGSFAAHNLVEGEEFLTSTDERFRPVHLSTGPDGALYIVDMYRGVIQHRLFVTTFLRRQIEERELELPIGLGRIWRVVRTDAARDTAPDLAQASWTELAAELGHPNGWRRDAAQRIFVEEGARDDDAVDLARAALGSVEPLARMHALWALAGMGWLEPQHCLAALGDPDPRVVHAAVRVSEPWLGAQHSELVDRLVAVATGADEHLTRQVVLSLGEGRSEATDIALLRVLDGRLDNKALRSAALSGLEGRELDVVLRLAGMTMWLNEVPGRAELLRELSRCVVREGRFDRIEHLLYIAATRPPLLDWQGVAMLKGVLGARPKGPDGEPSYISLAEEPTGYGKLTRMPGELSAELGREVAASLAWPGKRGVELPDVRPLTSVERARFDRGRVLYAAACAQCHQESGRGEDGKAPPLRFSPYVLGDPDRLARIVRWGLVGPVELEGKRWDMEMPAWGSSDEDLAAVLTYLRREWGHGADPVEIAAIRAVSEAVGKRGQPFTLSELEPAAAEGTRE